MRNYNTFTYINNDTLSLMSNLHHNISDLEGRASFEVAGYVPVYDYRLDSVSDSPFVYKFGKIHNDVKVTKYPNAFKNSSSNNTPFNILSNNLDGILFEDDVYLWRSLDPTSNYNLSYGLNQSGSVDASAGSVTSLRISPSVAYVECFMGPRKGDIVFIPSTAVPMLPEDFNTDVILNDNNGAESSYWNNNNKKVTTGSLDKISYWNIYKTYISSDETTLKNLTEKTDKLYNIKNNKLLVGIPNTPAYELISSTTEINNPNDIEVESLDVIEYNIDRGPTYDNESGIKFNVKVPLYSARSLKSNSSKWVKSNNDIVKSTQDAVYKLSKQASLTELENNNLSVFESIRYFAKSAIDENGNEKTIANYRIEFTDQVGSIRFNKIITYVRLYLKDEDGQWNWSERLFPFSITLLPEPVVKSNIGYEGVDTFEIDIEIDYNQGNSSINIQDVNSIHTVPSFIPVNNFLKPESDAESIIYSQRNGILNKGAEFIGLQSDRRLFLSTVIDPLDETNSSDQWVLEKNSNEWKTKNRINNNIGRLNSDNRNYIFKDVDFSKLKYKNVITLTTSLGTTTDYDVSLDTHVVYVADEFSNFDAVNQILYISKTQPEYNVHYVDLINTHKLEIIQYYTNINKSKTKIMAEVRLLQSNNQITESDRIILNDIISQENIKLASLKNNITLVEYIGE